MVLHLAQAARADASVEARCVAATGQAGVGGEGDASRVDRSGGVVGGRFGNVGGGAGADGSGFGVSGVEGKGVGIGRSRSQRERHDDGWL